MPGQPETGVGYQIVPATQPGPEPVHPLGLPYRRAGTFGPGGIQASRYAPDAPYSDSAIVQGQAHSWHSQEQAHDKGSWVPVDYGRFTRRHLPWLKEIMGVNQQWYWENVEPVYSTLQLDPAHLGPYQDRPGPPSFTTGRISIGRRMPVTIIEEA